MAKSCKKHIFHSMGWIQFSFLFTIVPEQFFCPQLFQVPLHLSPRKSIYFLQRHNSKLLTPFLKVDVSDSYVSKENIMIKLLSWQFHGVVSRKFYKHTAVNIYLQISFFSYSDTVSRHALQKLEIWILFQSKLD